MQVALYVFVRGRKWAAGLSPSSESSQRSSVGVCVGAGVGVALASIIAVLVVAIVIVALMVAIKRKQTDKKEEVTVTRDSRNTLENPTYSGTGQQSFYFLLLATQYSNTIMYTCTYVG